LHKSIILHKTYTTRSPRSEL